MKSVLLKIPLLTSLAGSLSWLVFPDISLLAADRWIILNGILLSIFAGYGILHIVKNLKPRLASAVTSCVLVAFAAIGLAYATMPYDNPFIIYDVALANIEHFAPVTMQFNSLDIEDNDKLFSTIAWLNRNTEPDAVIMGESHWRGFMEMYLEGQRTYRFSNITQAHAKELGMQGKHVYLIEIDGNAPAMFVVLKQR